ncbi:MULTISPECIES: hypothetical protein [Muribaculaceae]|uniref:hypothetical protein n=1 Tax=Muribaculaceae TaxID=2005473 RepID=UPI002674F1F1|nr:MULTISPECIES: hypothetical protein [Muribaculaceae]
MKQSVRNAVLLLAAMAAGLANATVYLMKEGKVVAAYYDDEVTSISFDLPQSVDIATKSIFMHQVYYADAQKDSGYNYNLQITDVMYDDKGFIPDDAIFYQLRFWAPEPQDPAFPFLPESTHTLGNENSLDEWTIRPGERSYVVYERQPHCLAPPNLISDIISRPAKSLRLRQ